jgi:hypothetical protein
MQVEGTKCKLCEFDTEGSEGAESLIWTHLGTLHDKVSFLLQERGLKPVPADIIPRAAINGTKENGESINGTKENGESSDAPSHDAASLTGNDTIAETAVNVNSHGTEKNIVDGPVQNAGLCDHNENQACEEGSIDFAAANSCSETDSGAVPEKMTMLLSPEKEANSCSEDKNANPEVLNCPQRRRSTRLKTPTKDFEEFKLNTVRLIKLN